MHALKVKVQVARAFSFDELSYQINHLHVLKPHTCCLIRRKVLHNSNWLMYLTHAILIDVVSIVVVVYPLP